MYCTSWQDIKEELKNNYSRDLADYLMKRDRREGKRQGWICPCCGSGSGENGTGLDFIEDTKIFLCHSEDKGRDIITLWAVVNGLDVRNDFITILKQMCDAVHLSYDDIKNTNYKPISKTQSKPVTVDNTPQQKDEVEDEAQKEKNREFIIKAQANFSEGCEAMQYLQCRGFKYSTCKKYGLGFDTYYKSVVIPTSESSYIYRSIHGKDRGNSKGKQHIFNEELLFQIIAKNDLKQYLFICEGWADSLSFLDNECQSIALNSTNNSKKFLEIITKNKNTFDKDFKDNFVFLLAFDNDNAGKQATALLMEELKKLGLKCFDVTSYLLAYGGNNYKDINEAYVDNREEFIKRVTRIDNANSVEGIENVLYIGKSSMDRLMKLNKSYELTTEPIKTGFKNIDSALYQGFRPGLYILGAVSSLGKTSFALQIASNIAEAGQDVLLFSLEMSAEELLAKVLSRITYETNEDYALNTAEILYNNFSKIQRDQGEYVRGKAFERLQGFAEHIFISEGIGNITTDEIRNQISEHKRITGNVPFVVIDYVQIICPLDYKMTDKQATDRNITELKRISRDFDCVVFGISSFNRESYKEEVSMASFKESGAIEYGSDVLMGLQYAEIERKEEEIYNPKTKTKTKVLESDTAYKARRAIELKKIEEQARNGEFIPLQIKILKNRNGSKNKVDIYYKPKYNYFTDDVDKTKDDFELPF